MSGYEIMPDDPAQADVDKIIADLAQRNDAIINLIINKMRTNNDGWEMFYSLHKRREDKDNNGLLGVAKLFRSKRDCLADLLIDIAIMEDSHDTRT